MISFLRGELAEKNAPLLVVDVGGVGYELSASLTTFASLPALGQQVQLLTHFVVREDSQQLYGFADDAERALFRALIRISGVGPKLALGLLSGMDVAAFARCVREKDIAALTRLPGVGKKTAERLVVEMHDTMAQWPQAGSEPAGAGASSPATSQAAILADAETALVALGYKPTEASRAIAALNIEDYDSTEQLIRAALQTMLNR